MGELRYKILYIFRPVIKKMRDPNRSLLIGTSISRDIVNGMILYCKVRFLTVIDFVLHSFATPTVF